MNMKKRLAALIALLLALALCLSSCLDGLDGLGGFFGDETGGGNGGTGNNEPTGGESSYLLENVPAFDGKTPYVSINGGDPFFTKDEIVATSYESYSELDALGRCGVAVSCIGRDLMPTEDRGSIGSVKPSGWQSVKYDIVDGKYLYNRCHLIGFQLTGENANEKNLITGTRYLNIDGMLSFENMVADYIKETNNHVMYRVTPIFEGNNLVASGVLIEALSVEDDGAGIKFCVYAYNAQPGITIDYSNGNSALSGTALPDTDKGGDESGATDESESTYVLNTSSKKFHREGCSGASSIKEENKLTYTGSRDELIEAGYTPCGSCKP